VLLRDFVVNAFSLVVLSSVSAAVVSHLLLGDKTFLHTPPFAIHSSWELIAYAVLGALMAVIVRIFVRTMVAIESSAQRWRVPDVWKPAIGGLCVGVIGWLLPPILGPGIEFMTSIVRGQVTYVHGTLLIFSFLLVAKIIGTSLTLGSGGSGGLLTPSFFCGGMAGALFGLILGLLFPQTIPAYGPYALVGMVAFFAALSHAPLTAIILLFELTHDERVILPAMVCSVLAAFVSHRLNPHSYELLRLLKKGLTAQEVEAREFTAEIEVGTAMEKDVVCLRDTDSFDALRQTIETSRHTGFPVVSEQGLLIGLLSDNELHAALDAGGVPAQLTVGAMMRKDVRTVTPDMSLRAAILAMNESGQDRVPVVDNLNPQHIVGLITRSHIITAYKRH
jgi:CIC family chloride channel protein